MTITCNWFLSKNETCFALHRSAKYHTCSFLDYLLMVGSTRAEQCPAFAETPALSIKRSKKLKLWNMMHNDAKLTWGRIY